MTSPSASSVVLFVFIKQKDIVLQKFHRRMSQVCGKNFMSDGVVHEYCRKFKDGRTDVHEEEGRCRKFKDGRTDVHEEEGRCRKFRTFTRKRPRTQVCRNRRSCSTSSRQLLK
ncbi:hypothetical protein AVEN_40116-1 [Araneus ventricosus]|uniref:Mos1 transposase HTH domain-containing protein n=1 Tax=Araneus ventricosus TaxID=182803 RepID=A0A4Y2ELB0_ARAVE|nr:hypothetical protein AVEN_40116-1 [Araneus ventricosus]